MTHRWRPPLPTLGRAAPRISVNILAPTLTKLEEYYAERHSVSDIFECRLNPSYMRFAGIVNNGPRFLWELTPNEQCHALLKNLYFKVSKNFRVKLSLALHAGRLNHVRSWFHTANAAVLPLLISSVESLDYREIDRVASWALENCANNYAHFQSRWKALKKSLRKGFALRKWPKTERFLSTYVSAFFRHYPTGDSDEGQGRYVLLWCQTRATGMADSKMMELSVEKFVSTVTEPCRFVPMNPQVLLETAMGAIRTPSHEARISVGPTSCLEATRELGGKTAKLMDICRRESALRYVYDPTDLSRIPTGPRSVSSSQDVISWAIQDALEHPAFVRTVRLHVVTEPSKARTITVAPYAYQCIMGVMAHMFQATLTSSSVRSGLKADRHLWKFLRETLNPQSPTWDKLSHGTVYALSTDLSEATDFGNLSVARQIWDVLIRLADRPGFPKGLAYLARNLYCGKRYIFVPHRNKYRLITRSRGWFMGDMMTKVILTVSHDYCCRLSLLSVYSLVGDDETALDNDRAKLERQLVSLRSLDFKVSEDDTFISDRLMFYCEEGSLVPQGISDAIHVRQRRNIELLYLDYPRIRLLLAERSETDSYSMTNVGRFSLLGKETRWVYNTNRRALLYFATASVIQHIIVPQDADTLCPYTPIEIGGDGAFPFSANFLRKVVEDHCRDPRESMFRMSSLMTNTFSHKFVRSPRLNEVVHKHHLWLENTNSLRPLLPKEAVITPSSDANRIMLRSVRLPNIESPSQTFMRLCRGFYFREIFRGNRPLEPTFSISRRFSGGYTSDPYVDYDDFCSTWANPGFRFANFEDYFVRRDLIESLDPLNLGWVWDTEHYRSPNLKDTFDLWIKENVSIVEASYDDIMNFIIRDQSLPDRVVKRLNLFMESDSYVLQTLPRENIPPVFLITTRDYRLAGQVRRSLDSRDPDRQHWVVAIDPSLYLTGRVGEIIGRHVSGPWSPEIPDLPIKEDPGSVLHCDYTEFTDGFPHREDIFDVGIDVFPHHRDDHVVIAAPLKEGGGPLHI